MGDIAMKVPLIAIAGGTTAIVIGGVSIVGCSSDGSKSSPPASSGSASSTSAPESTKTKSSDYSALLIKATDITAPGDTFTAQPPTLNPGGKDGVAAVFANQGDTREIGDTILVLPDATGANTALDGAVAALSSAVVGGTPESASVGSSGTMVSGTSPDGSKAVTVLLFAEGKTFTTLEFDSAPEDPVPPEFVNDVGQKQDAAIKAGLPG
jgi:hypothetical protein